VPPAESTPPKTEAAEGNPPSEGQK
jgi:hypothetical protein